MKHVARPGKRKRGRVERAVHLKRIAPARVYRISPDEAKPRFIVEVHVSRTRRQMRDTTRRFGCLHRDVATQGLVRSLWSSVTRKRRHVYVNGHIVARMFLNLTDLQQAPADILAHECTHAGMTWAHLQRADLSRMPGEEVLAYAVGTLTQKLANALFGKLRK